MRNNQIIFDIHDNKVRLHYKDKSMTITDLLQVVSTGLLLTLKSIVDAAPENLRQQVTEDLYDMYNAAASNTLHYFAPEIDMRPHLTAQAILDAENSIIEKEFQKTQKDPEYVSPIAEKRDMPPTLKVVK
jgi:hypothetical protein